jgi:hypothetical protein
VQDCYKLHINEKALNENPVGLRSITLDSVNNATINLIDPVMPSEIIGKTRSTFEVVAIDPRKNASAVVVLTDRTNKTWRIPYNYVAEHVDMIPDNPAVLEFGEVAFDSTRREKLVLTNPLQRNVQIKAVQLVLGNQGFRITRPVAAQLPITLKPNESTEIEVEFTSTERNKHYEDSVKISLSCTQLAAKVEAETITPCISMDDYDFGVLMRDQDTTRTVQICNQGMGYVSFTNPAGGDVITWLDQNFTISKADRDRLKNTILGPGIGPADPDVPSCISINVTFKASEPGTYRTTARFWASTRECRDTSVWTATVSNLSDVETDATTGTALKSIDPNPFHGTTRIEFTLAMAGHATLELFDISGRRIALLLDAEMQQGDHAALWDASHLPAGTYYCRLTVGEWNSTQPVVVR